MKRFVALMAFCASNAAAQPYTRIEVWNYNTGGSCVGGAVGTTYSGTGAISVALPACAEKVYIYSCDASNNPGPVTNIPRITLTGGPTGANPLPVQISLGFAFNQGGANPTPVGANWGGLNARGLGKSQFYGGIGGNLTGSIDADQIFRFDADGDIQAEVRAGGAGNGGTFIVEGASITSSGSVVLETNNIGRVTTGSHAGLIEATAGSITVLDVSGNVTGRVYAVNGSMGTVTIGGSLTSLDFGGNPPFRTKNGINKLTATSVSANIDAALNSGTGKVGLFKTTNGAMSGTLKFKELSAPTGGGEAGVIVNGNLSGNLHLISGGTHTEKIQIKGSLSGDILFDDATDLDTQIVINAGNAGGTWTSTGEVILGYDGTQQVLSTTASPPNQGPYYESTSSDLGGGAVGLVPYHVHDLDCNPPHDAGWDDAAGATPLLNSAFSGGSRSARMRFYGPVRSAWPGGIADPAEKPVAFWYWISRTSQWRDITDAVTISMKEGAATGTSREITITGAAALPPGFYAATVNTVPRDVPNGQNLYHVYCDSTLDTTPPSPATNVSGALEYRFRLWPDCDNNGVIDAEMTLCNEGGTCCADLAGGGVTGSAPDEAVTIDDLIFFLVWYEAGQYEADIAGSSGACEPDGGVTVDDLLAFLTHFEGGC